MYSAVKKATHLTNARGPNTKDNMPNLIVIVGNMAYRYVNGKLDQKASMEHDPSIPLAKILAELEHFRLHGL